MSGTQGIQWAAHGSFMPRDNWANSATMPNKHKTPFWNEGLGHPTLGKQPRHADVLVQSLAKCGMHDGRGKTNINHSLRSSWSTELYLILHCHDLALCNEANLTVVQEVTCIRLSLVLCLTSSQLTSLLSPMLGNQLHKGNLTDFVSSHTKCFLLSVPINPISP